MFPLSELETYSHHGTEPSYQRGKLFSLFPKDLHVFSCEERQAPGSRWINQSSDTFLYKSNLLFWLQCECRKTCECQPLSCFCTVTSPRSSSQFPLDLSGSRQVWKIYFLIVLSWLYQGKYWSLCKIYITIKIIYFF